MATKQIWLNLPSKNIEASRNFFTNIGFELNTHYGNSADSACILIGDSKLVLMLFSENTFKSFTQNELVDTSKGTEILFSIDAESKDDVDEIAKKVEVAGGTIFSKPAEVQGWMYGFGFLDLDGHRWNVLYMDMNKMQQPSALHAITVETTINTTIEKVWDCFTNPEHIVNWNYASDDWHTTAAKNDLKVNGIFSYRMEAKDGSFGFDFMGTYTVVKTFEEIAYTLGDNRKANIQFTQTAAGVSVVEIFEAENENPIELQQTGWQAILDNFKKYAEAV